TNMHRGQCASPDAAKPGFAPKSVRNRNMADATAPRPTSLLEKLTYDIQDLAQLTGLSQRHLRRLDASRDIPGRCCSGRRVMFAAEAVRRGLPGAPPPAPRGGREQRPRR